MSNGGTKCVVAIVVAVLVVIMIIALVASSLKKLASNEVGIKYDTVWRSLSKETFREGLHTGPPGYEFIVFPSTFNTMSYSLRCLNKDGVKISLDVSFQYKARVAKLYDIVMDFKDFDGYQKILRYVGESALHDACSQFNTTEFQSLRSAFQAMVKEKVKVKYDDLWAQTTDLQVSNIDRPSQYEEAVRSKERAREDIEVARKEQPRLLLEAETTLREANTSSRIIIDKANSEANVLASQADAEARAITEQYLNEAKAYGLIMNTTHGLGFSAEGFISYLGVRVLSSAKNPVYISMESPAKTSYK